MLEGDWPTLRLPACDVQQPRRHPALLIVLVVTASLLLSSGCYARHEARRTTISFSRFLEAVGDGDLVREQPIRFTPTTVSGVVRTDEGEQRFVATIPPGYDRAELVDELARQGFEIEGHN